MPMFIVSLLKERCRQKERQKEGHGIKSFALNMANLMSETEK